MRAPRAAESNGQQSEHCKIKKKKSSANFKLLSQIRGNLITSDFLKFAVYVRGYHFDYWPQLSKCLATRLGGHKMSEEQFASIFRTELTYRNVHKMNCREMLVFTY